jgi:hypothetical protein
MQPFVVYKKQLSVHTEDRDIRKWPTSNIFDIELPVEYKNIVSMRLADIELPASYYVFSEKNQNLTFYVSIDGSKTLITISEGTYTPAQLALELQGQLNQSSGNTGFLVIYNSTSMKFAFLNSTTFSLIFNTDDSSFYDQYTQWGLGSYLGFCKDVYTSTELSGVNPYTNYGDGSTGYTSGYIVVAPNTASLFGDSYIYMELDFFNSMDEILPYTERSNNTFQSKNGGNHNSAFAKIPTGAIFPQKTYVSKETFLTNIFFSDPPLERVQKFKFKFRYHDGRPVYFGNTNFSFTIEITMLRPDSIKTPIKVNPNHYQLM